MRRVRVRGENGQTLVVVALFMVVLLGMAAFAVDVGRAYVAYRHLQAATEAAGGAAAQYPGNLTDAVNAGYRYSACTDPAENANCPGKNTYADLQNVTTTVSPQCVLSDGSPCPSGTANNAIHVEEQANVSLFFGRVLGFGSMTLKAASNVLFKGGVPHPLDVLLVLDTTGSMGSDCGRSVTDIPGTPTKLDCAKAGIRAFLRTMWPCAQGPANCTPDPASPGNVLNPVDKVGLMVFPALVNDSAANLATRRAQEVNCDDDLDSSDVSYNSPFSYLAVLLSSDFRASDTAPLNGTTSNLVKSVYWAQCPGGVYPTGGGSSIGGFPNSNNDRTGAINSGVGTSITGGPASSSDRSGASNGSGSLSISGGSSSSSNVTLASNGSGGGTITFGSAASGANSSSGASTLVLTKPSGVVNNDVLVAGITVNGGSNTTITPPSGWTIIRRTNNSTNVGSATYYHVVTNSGSEPASYTWNLSGSSTLRASGGIVRYTGVDTSNPIDVSNGGTGSSNTPTAPGVTTTVTGDMVIGFFGLDTSGTFTAPTGMTERYDVTNSSSSGPASEASDYTQAAGATGNKAATSTQSNSWVAQLVALRPAIIAGPTSISIDRPSTRADGDFLLVSLTAQGLDTGSICAPDGTWTLVRPPDTQGSGAASVTQATFWSFRSGTAAETYVFTFRTGGCGGSAASVSASAVAVRYTGVNTTTPIDTSLGATGNGSTLTAPSVTTSFDNEEIVRLYGSGSPTMSSGNLDQRLNGPTTSTGVEDSSQASAGSTSTDNTTTSSPDNWVAHTVALRPATGPPTTSITINRPSTRVDGDFLLVSVTAQGLDTGFICAPDGTWTLVRQDTQGSGAASVTQATFWSFRSGTAAEAYTFTFRTGACPDGGSVASASASAVAVRYTGVNTTTPIDVSLGATGNSNQPTAPSVTTSFDNERIVRLYGSGNTSMNDEAYDFPGSTTSTGVEDSTQASAGSTNTAYATTSSADNWVAHTVALRPVPPVGLGGTSISINRPTNRSAGDFLLVSVTAQGLGAGSICAPDGTWALVRQDTQGSLLTSVTQATFWSFRSGTAAETYTFIFESGACTGGSPASVEASAVAVRYTNVDPAMPIDVSLGATGNSNQPTAPSVTTTFDNDRVVRLFGSGNTTMTNVTFTPSPPGSTTSTGVKDSTKSTAGSTGTATATTSSSDNWVAHTVAVKFGGCSGSCFYGAENPGGSGSYLTVAINEAQAELNAHGRPGATHVIIILSDGEFQSKLGDTQPCHSAIAAASNAKSLYGTWIYSIAYGTLSSSEEDSGGGGGCPDHATAPLIPQPYGVCTMHRIADPTSNCADPNPSDPAKRFFNTPTDGDLEAVFEQIGTDLTTTRIVPP
jgi:hypothetical protein